MVLVQIEGQHRSRLHLLAIMQFALDCSCSLTPVRRVVCALLNYTFTDSWGLELSSFGAYGLYLHL